MVGVSFIHIVQGDVPMGGQKRSQVLRDCRVGRKRQTELLESGAAGLRPGIQRDRREEPVDQHAFDFLARDVDLHATTQQA